MLNTRTMFTGDTPEQPPKTAEETLAEIAFQHILQGHLIAHQKQQQTATQSVLDQNDSQS